MTIQKAIILNWKRTYKEIKGINSLQCVVRHWKKFLRQAVNAMPGSVPGQVGWGFEHSKPEWLESVPACQIPSNQTHSMILCFYDSIYLWRGTKIPASPKELNNYVSSIYIKVLNPLFLHVSYCTNTQCCLKNNS